MSVRPSHADLPFVSAPLLPRKELDDLRVSDDGRSQGTRQLLLSSDSASCPRANQEEDGRSRRGVSDGDIQERLSGPIRDQKAEMIAPIGEALHVETPPPCTQSPPTIHRKAHRKTNRRKTSSSSSSLAGRIPDPSIGVATRPSVDPDPDPDPRAASWPRPGPSQAQDQTAFPSDQSDAPDQTPEEVRPSVAVVVDLPVLLTPCELLFT